MTRDPCLMAETTLVTGLPSYTARRMVAKIIAADEHARVLAVVPAGAIAEVQTALAMLTSTQRDRVEVLTGDVAAMDLGLSGTECRRVFSEVSCIHHMAACYPEQSDRERADRTCVAGARHILELSRAITGLRRLCFWSSACVAGDREGVVMEDELDCGQRWHNVYEESRYRAEMVVRQRAGIVPTTIFRPSIIVGDSKSGEIGPYDGPHALIQVLMRGALDLQLPLPGRGDGPFNVVPVDFVIDAAHRLSLLDCAASKTYHLVDPAPISARRLVSLVAEHAQRKVPRTMIPPALAKALLRVPLPWGGHLQAAARALADGFGQRVLYNSRQTLEDLRGTGIWCPSFDSYVDVLVVQA